MLQSVLSGSIERLGAEGGLWSIQSESNELKAIDGTASNHAAALDLFLGWMQETWEYGPVTSVGHRIVHGGSSFVDPVEIDESVVTELQRLCPLDPGHMPQAIACIEAIRRTQPELRQIACFDTAFHQTMPRVATMVTLPRVVDSLEIKRYGFHGLSYEYVAHELASIDPESRRKRTVVAHLGNGASMVAIKDGHSVDTTMGMTPTGGLMMGSRSGDLDPGMLAYLMHSRSFDETELESMINQQSGLLGVSGISADMRDVLSAAPSHTAAREAIDLYCYIAKKHLGSMIAVLGGIDRLVFTGGIGEHAAEVRAQICSGLEFAGIDIDVNRNRLQSAVISSDLEQVEVRVIHTNEDMVIARHCQNIIATHQSRP